MIWSHLVWWNLADTLRSSLIIADGEEASVDSFLFEGAWAWTGQETIIELYVS